jgi:hypothetical protein
MLTPRINSVVCANLQMKGLNLSSLTNKDADFSRDLVLNHKLKDLLFKT